MFYELKNIRRDVPADGKVIVYWLGGAGHVFKFATGQIICVDPYLSDYCEQDGDEFRRICPAPIRADELQFDLLLISHEHGDHLDEESFDDYLRTNPNCRILTPQCCSEFFDSKKAKYETIAPGTVSTLGEVVIETVDADHGDLSPDAVGFMIRFSGRSIYRVGDTSLNEPLLDKAIKCQPEILVTCINGAYGNLNEKEAAVLARKCGSKFVIPTHFGLFVGHGGCPRRFSEYLKTESPQSKLVVITPGRGIVI